MARKSKDFGKLLRQQPLSQVQQNGMEQLEKKVKTGPLGNKFAGIVANPQGEVKMSEVLESFVEPYLDSAETRKEKQMLLEIAVIAWNLAIMPEADRQPLINQMLEAGVKSKDPVAQQEMKAFFEELIDRKQKFFAQNQRFIVDFQLQDAGRQFHLSVASTLSNPLAGSQQTDKAE